MAESIRLRGKRVLLIKRGRQRANICDDEIAEVIEEEAKRQGIDILYEEEIEEIIGDGAITSIRTNKRTYETDLLLIATGVRPNTSFLNGTDVKLAQNGAVHVNEWLETNVTDVYAAGDCAMKYGRVNDADQYVPP